MVQQFFISLKGTTVTFVIDNDGAKETIIICCADRDEAELCVDGLLAKLREHGVDMTHTTQKDMN